jgi:hypothetical protein
LAAQPLKRRASAINRPASRPSGSARADASKRPNALRGSGKAISDARSGQTQGPASKSAKAKPTNNRTTHLTAAIGPRMQCLGFLLADARQIPRLIAAKSAHKLVAKSKCDRVGGAR